MSGHSHRHDHDHGNSHASGHAQPAPAPREGRLLTAALLLTAGYALVEVLGGWFANSLALLSDAGHMAADAGALLIALVAARLAIRPVSARKSFGYGRAEVIGAFVNGLTMLAIVVWIIVEAVGRVFTPVPVYGASVMLIASLGLVVNLVVLGLLTRDARHGHAGHSHGDLNSRAAAVHVLGDLLGSAAAIIAGAVVHFTGWTLIDPLLSVLVAMLILGTTWRLLAASVDVLMESVPDGVDHGDVGRALASIEGVVSVHDLHVWQTGTAQRALSAHLLLRDAAAWPRILSEARARLLSQFAIDHVTLQPDWLPVHETGRVIPLKLERTHPQ